MKDMIREVVRSVMPDKSRPLTDEVDLIDGLGFDSIAMLELITGIEDAFGVTFDDDVVDLDNFKNINVILTTLETCRAAN